MNTQMGSGCRILAHRGANRQAFENTLAAFDRALACGSDGLETDVQLSRDGIPVLWHDRFLGKLGLPDHRIDDFDFEHLKDLRLTHDNRTNQHDCLIRLTEFLTTYRGRGTLDIEVKIRDGESVPRQREKIRLTLQLIDTATITDVFVSSFNLTSLIFAHHCSQSVPLFYILDHRQQPAEVARALKQQPFLSGFCLPIAWLDAKLFECLRAHDKTIAVYTGNTAAEIRAVFAHDADLLITDDPEQALRLRP